MVDQEARRQYAELVRQFTSGRMTNDEYEAGYDAITADKNDPAVSEAYYQLWLLYDDIKTHRMTGIHRLDRDGRRAVARMVLFLQSDKEYHWPENAWLGAGRMLLLFGVAAVAVLLLGWFPARFLFILSAAASAVAVLFTYYSIRIVLERRQWETCGDTGAWPLLHQADLDEAVKHPHLLNGGR